MISDIEKGRKYLKKKQKKYYNNCTEIDKIEKYLNNLLVKYGEQVELNDHYIKIDNKMKNKKL